MSKTKIFLIGAVLLIFTGLLLFGGAMTAYGWDFTKLSTVTYETNTYEADGIFSSISISSDTADIIFEAAENSKCKVICHEQENVGYTVTVQEGVLMIRSVDRRKWYEYIGISAGTPKTTVYLPDTEYDLLTINESTGDIIIPQIFKFNSMDISASTGNVTNYASASETVRIKTSTGRIHIESITASALDLSSSTGSITVSDVTCSGDIKTAVSTGRTNVDDTICRNFISNGSTGDLSLKNVLASEQFSIKRSTGDVTLDGCDAAEIFIETDTGDVKGTVLSEKIFTVETDTGRIDVPQSITGGNCIVKTDTGNVKLSIQ